MARGGLFDPARGRPGHQRGGGAPAGGGASGGASGGAAAGGRSAPRGARQNAGGTPGADAGGNLFDVAGPGSDRARSLPRALTVSQLTAMISETLEGTFPAVWVEGEVSNFHRHSSGHVYLTLKDEDAQLAVVIWRSVAARLRFQIRDGDKVLASGRISVYRPRGQYQLIAEKIEPVGLGALQAAFEELKRRLAAEGLFDQRRKKPLPAFPRRIGLVTSPEGAAVRDMIKVIRSRWPKVELILAPVRVQGEGAAEQIARAVENFNRLACADVLIIGRGGGSIEDLWAFNEERTVRAVAASRIPTISAVGHEVDVTLCDLAADVRAATPSNAGEIVVPVMAEVEARLDELGSRLTAAAGRTMETRRERLRMLASLISPARALDRVSMLGQRLDDLSSRISAAAASRLRERKDAILRMAGRLDALSPLRVLSRGYSITRRAGQPAPLLSAEGLAVGDRLETLLAKGKVISRVEGRADRPGPA
ncbi:MAG: exodeoxyribonuclease VII large subunit [Planctomycetota bacterium]|nr:exodeoxyribonuclease VII large subunit [Planctomycetota bacterium]